MLLSAQLRAAINNSDLTLYRIAKDSGVSWAVLYRFLNGQDIKLASADKLAAYFDMRLTRPKKIKVKRTAGARRKLRRS